MPKKKPVAAGLTEPAVPPRAVSGRRYKALVPWRFQPGFARRHANIPAAAAATPRGSVGGSGAKGCGSARVGGQGDLQLRRGTRSAAAKGSDGEKMENGELMTGGARILVVDSSGGGIVVVDSPDGGKMENGAAEDCQSKRGALGAAAKSSAVSTPLSGAGNDKRATRSATARSSDAERMETGPRSGAEMDCQFKRETRSAAAKSTSGGKMESTAHSGAKKGCQSKRGTDSAIVKSSHGEKLVNGAHAGAQKDGGEICMSEGSKKSAVDGNATVKSSSGEKLENGAHASVQKDCGEICMNEGSKKPQVDGSATVKSSSGEKLESRAHAGVQKDGGEICMSEGSKKSHVDISVTVKSSSGEKLENGAPAGDQKDGGEICMSEGSKKSHVNGSVAVKSSSGEKLEHAGAQKDGGEICMSEGSKKSHVDQNATVKSSSGEKLENGAHAVAQKDCGEICMPEGSKKSHVNGSGLKRSCSAADLVGEELEGTGNRAAKKINVAAKGCSSAGPVGNDNVSYCRKGRKEIVPWRFQIGYKRSFSTAFCSNGGSPETPEYRAQGSSTQCTSGTRSTVRCYASPHSGVRVSAVRNFSSGKGEKETRTAYKKMRSDNNDHNQGMPETGVSLARKTVMKTLQDFQLIYKKLLHELDKSKEALDLQAYKIFRDRFPAQCDDKRYVGNVPGVHVGDIFHVRVELCVVGLHRPHRIGIDHMKDANGTCIAVSIVAYARFSDIKKNLDALVYSGSTTATINQKIDGTNLALKKSMDTNTPVRVIHGFSTKGNGQRKMLIYGGLYLVEKYWRERESEDCYVYMFRLRRMAGQKHIDIEEILKSAHTEPYDGVIMKDISQGLERIPIPVVNSISDECPMPYVYMSRLKYPRNYQPAPPAGCACVGGCSASKRCACAAKNGGDIPFNDKGRIIVAKPLVYECGPSCKCPPTCHNRVGQKGMKFRLQIFKTKSMGWGVKTLDFIPIGSFVCEYIGEVLDDEEAQKRMTDEYLFAIGHNYYDEALWEGLSRSIPSLQKSPGEDEDAGFAVDASNMGNFAKFINHSCSPNLYAQNVLYDHDDKSAPHIMFFACEDIPPGQELAYHYNYAIDQVHDANGNIKKKKCLCGSVECDGWLY
ncbi:uncharacterized protein LOC124671525 [Lolium rigidum]|uniref:uncharacterized protein LOC124671525 n=1 Tax=Lolium rigidum TaxID=89674 RepID=UPI001F5D502F|nr:uncharacterized protein LOC124671525 [Lolium rigidum]